MGGKTEMFMTFNETKCTAYTLFKINVFQSNGNKIKLLNKTVYFVCLLYIVIKKWTGTIWNERMKCVYISTIISYINV